MLLTLRSLRHEQGYTQRQLAEIVGVAPMTILRYENGTRRPRRPARMMLAQALEVPVETIDALVGD